jgi:hypothetical protein
MNSELSERSRSSLRSSAQFWVSSSPFFESVLFLTPSLVPNELYLGENNVYNYLIKLYDSDGALVNELNYSITPFQLGVIELHNLMEGMKYESGIKHGWVDVVCERPSRMFCRLHAKSVATLMGELQPIGGQQRVCFPLTLGENRSAYLAAVNFSKEPSAVRCKLFIGKRSPEILFTVPGSGARLINLDAEFPDYKELEGPALLGYLRVSPRNDSPFGVQLIERIEGSKEEGLFGTLT